MVNKGEGPKSLSVSTLEEWLRQGKPVQLLDVRTPAEYGEGHIPQALSIPLEQVPNRLADLGTSTPIVVICHSGARAQVACQCLCGCPKEFDIWHLQGGTAAWRAAGFPVVAGAKSGWSVERQVRFLMGLLVVIGGILAANVSASWIALPVVVGAGLVIAAATDFCPMGLIIARAPWNRQKA